MKQYFALVRKFRYGKFGINEFILFDAFILSPNIFSHWSLNQCRFGISGVMSVPVFITSHFHHPPIRNGLMPHLWGINLSHIYAREVRWNFEFNSWYSSKICSCLSKKTLHSLHLLFFEMSTLKGDARVKLLHFTIFFFRPYVKIGESRIEFVCRNVIF
jgi:hypothetical protein